MMEKKVGAKVCVERALYDAFSADGGVRRSKKFGARQSGATARDARTLCGELNSLALPCTVLRKIKSIKQRRLTSAV